MIKNPDGVIYGHKTAAWEQSKKEAIRAILEKARSGGDPTISYLDLTRRIGSIPFDPDGHDFHYLLYEISREEDEACRGLLSALVVRRDDRHPGDGFWDVAKERGRDVTDKERCWVDEVKEVLKHCDSHPLAA